MYKLIYQNIVIKAKIVSMLCFQVVSIICTNLIELINTLSNKYKENNKNYLVVKDHMKSNNFTPDKQAQFLAISGVLTNGYNNLDNSYGEEYGPRGLMGLSGQYNYERYRIEDPEDAARFNRKQINNAIRLFLSMYIKNNIKQTLRTGQYGFMNSMDEKSREVRESIFEIYNKLSSNECVCDCHGNTKRCKLIIC